MSAPRYRQSRRIVFLLRALLVVACLPLRDAARADIYRWDNHELIPGTEGIEPGPGVKLDHRELSYADLRQLDLTGSHFDFSNLTNASLNGARLTNANLTGAVVAAANFAQSNLTQEQLYSTLSYQNKVLGAIALWGRPGPTGGAPYAWDFHGQNLRGAQFDAWFGAQGGSDLIGANFSGSDLTGAVFGSDTSLAAADTRGALGLDLSISNTILPDGTIVGLDLAAGDRLVVRNYHGNPDQGIGPIPVIVQDQITMANGGILQMLFDADPWDSTISFAPGIPVALGGTLELLFATEMGVAQQVGRTFDVFDWTGVNPMGQFQVSSTYLWDLSNLYTSGEVTLLPDADFNGDGVVDGTDLVEWRLNFGRTSDALNAQGDSDYDGDVDGGDFLAWQWQVGSGATANSMHAPEPAGIALMCVGLVALAMARSARASREERIMSRLVRHDWFLSRVRPGRCQATYRRATASSFPFHRRLRISRWRTGGCWRP